MRTIAYTFEADVHCPACTRRAAQRMKLDHNHPYAMGKSCKDEHAIEYDLVDSEGNLIHPAFDIDEHDFTHCSNCRERL